MNLARMTAYPATPLTFSIQMALANRVAFQSKFKMFPQDHALIVMLSAIYALEC